MTTKAGADGGQQQTSIPLWEYDHNGWRLMPMPQQPQIESEFQGFRRNPQDRTSTLEVVMYGRTYQIDFACMCQRNSKTGKQREIRRTEFETPVVAELETQLAHAQQAEKQAREEQLEQRLAMEKMKQAEEMLEKKVAELQTRLACTREAEKQARETQREQRLVMENTVVELAAEVLKNKVAEVVRGFVHAKQAEKRALAPVEQAEKRAGGEHEQGELFVGPTDGVLKWLHAMKNTLEEEVVQRLAGVFEEAQHQVQENAWPFMLIDDEDLRKAAERALRGNAHPWYEGAACNKMATAKVTRVERICNMTLFSNYSRSKQAIREVYAQHGLVANNFQQYKEIVNLCSYFPQVSLDVDVGEVLLFHGTSAAALNGIRHTGFDERCAKESGLYGWGVYFADLSCKSMQYSARGGCMLLARVVLGDPHFAANSMYGQKRAPLRQVTEPSQGMYASVISDPGTENGRAHPQVHREYIIFDGRQAYPDLVIHFEL